MDVVSGLVMRIHRLFQITNPGVDLRNVIFLCFLHGCSVKICLASRKYVQLFSTISIKLKVWFQNRIYLNCIPNLELGNYWGITIQVTLQLSGVWYSWRDCLQYKCCWFHLDNLFQLIFLRIMVWVTTEFF